MSVRACRKLGGREAVLNIGSVAARARLARPAEVWSHRLPAGCGQLSAGRWQQDTFLRGMAERVSA